MIAVRAVTLVAGVGAVLMFSVQPAQAQSALNFSDGAHWMAGYVVKPPQQMLGFGAGAVLPQLGQWGFYVDGRISTDGPSSSSIRDDWTRDDAFAAGHQRAWDHEGWTLFSLAVMRGLTPELAVYGGGSVVWRTVHTRFRYEELVGDRTQEVNYWVEHEAEERVDTGLVAGAFLRMAPWLAVQFGGQTAPRGFVVGAHFRVF